ncbi:MAG: GDSL-type esterase/lipase family protein, partial [Verrucomicrobiota bacterium]
VVVAGYGMNDGISLPFAEERFRLFRDGLERLRRKCAAAGARVIHVTPPVFEEKRAQSPGYAATLDRYAAWLVSQRAAGWEVIDTHTVLRDHLEQRWKSEPAYFLSGDGVHPGETGHWLLARTILVHLGVTEVAGDADPGVMVRRHPQGTAILAKVQARQRLLKDAWLTETGHRRPGLPRGVPLAEAKSRADAWEREIQALLKPA